jgi:hypothetical protein
MKRQLCIMACTFCRDPLFHRWLNVLDAEAHERDQAPFEPTEEFAKDFILTLCGIDSRNELDTNKIAAYRFHNLIRGPFVTWKAQQRAEGLQP